MVHVLPVLDMNIGCQMSYFFPFSKDVYGFSTRYLNTCTIKTVIFKTLELFLKI